MQVGPLRCWIPTDSQRFEKIKQTLLPHSLGYLGYLGYLVVPVLHVGLTSRQGSS